MLKFLTEENTFYYFCIITKKNQFNQLIEKRFHLQLFRGLNNVNKIYHKKNLSETITFLLFTYIKGCINIEIVRKVRMDENSNFSTITYHLV